MVRSEESAAALIDLAKAFEYVRLELVWEAGLRWNFPEEILRLMLETFAFIRYLVLNGAVSEAVATLSAIIAGSSFAIDALFSVLIGPCDHLAANHVLRDASRQEPFKCSSMQAHNRNVAHPHSLGPHRTA